MGPSEPIGDDEIILRRVPPGEPWQGPGPRVTSANFHLRADEAGVSVTRLKITGPRRLLELGGGRSEDGWRVAAARVADIQALGLKVVPKPREDDSGHAEIEPGSADLADRRVRRELAKRFVFLDPPSADTASSDPPASADKQGA